MPLDLPGLFVTGTDTGVGKTFVTCLIAAELQAEGRAVGVYKPACSGAVATHGGPVWEDVEALSAATGGRFDRDRIAPQRFLAPLAPPVAARAEGTAVDADALRSGAAWWRDHAGVELLLVEGAGGLLCPLTETETFADLAVDLALPTLVVARTGLGTINHTLLTVEVARGRGLNVAGVVLCEAVPTGDDASARTNAAEIERRSAAAVLGVVPHGRPARLLRDGRPARIDWFAIASIARP